VRRQDNPQGNQPICELEEHLVDQLGVGNVSVGGEVCLDCSPVVASRSLGLLHACTGIHRVELIELSVRTFRRTRCSFELLEKNFGALRSRSSLTCAKNL
jgi:hypothetical protein